LELLALLLLTAAAARPFLADDGSRDALLLDNSLSMQTKSSNGSSRLEAARNAADDWLDESKGSSRFDVYSTSPRLQKIATRVSTSGARAALARISSALSSDPPASAVAELARSGQYKNVVVFTDRAFEGAAGEQDKKVEVKGNSLTHTEVVTVGEASTNIYLSSAQIEAGETPGSQVVSAIAAVSGPAEVDATLRLFSAGPAESARELASRALKIQPSIPAEAVFELDASAVSSEAYQLRLSIPNSTPDANTIQEDDVAWLTSGNSSTTEALLVSPQASPGDSLGLDAVPGLKVSPYTPEQYVELSTEQIEQYSLMLFHQSAPSTVTRKATLLILPPRGNPIFPILDEQNTPSITSWAKEHSITSYLRVPLLSPKNVVTFSESLWTQPVISVEKGTLVIAGESRGVRFAGVGMELLPFEGMRTPSSTVLLLNLLSWLGGGGNLSAVLKTGDLLPLKEDSQWQITDPAQRSHSVDTSTEAKNAEHSFPLSLPGLYVVKNMSKQGQPPKMLAVNSLFPEESSTFDSLPLSLQKVYAHPPRVGEDSEPLWPMLLIAAFVLLAIDYSLRAWSGRANNG
jgi:hypothetical protein